MSFFIKGKYKKENKKFKNIINNSESGNKSNNKRKRPDEEIDSDLEDDLTLQNDYKHSSDSEIEETVQEKRLRLAHTYLKEIELKEKERLETEDVDKNLIAQRLKEDVLEKFGKLPKKVAAQYSHCGDYLVLKCKDHSRSITCLTVSSDDKYIYSASDDYSIVKWSLKTRKKILTVKRTDKNGHKKKILSLALTSDNKYLASGGLEAKVNIWNPEDLTLLHVFSGHKIDVTGLVFRKNTHQLFRWLFLFFFFIYNLF